VARCKPAGAGETFVNTSCSARPEVSGLAPPDHSKTLRVFFNTNREVFSS